MKGNQLKAGVIISYATQAVQILSGLIYTPVMLRLLGQNEYGLYQLVFSVVSYLGLLSLGFGSSYMRFYSRYKVKNESEEIARLNGMFFVVFSVIAFLCLVCGSVICVNIDVVLGGKLTLLELQKAKILMAILVVSMAFTLLDSVFINYITAHERFMFQKLITFLSALLNPFITLPLLLLGYGSVAVVTVTALLSFFVLIANVVFCRKKLSMAFKFKKINFSVFKEVWAFTVFVFISQIVDQINWNVDKILLGKMSGTAGVAIYGVAAQLNTMYLAISTSVSNVFIPRVNIMVAKDNSSKELTDLFVKVGRIQFVILALILSVFILFGQSFIRVWAGEGYEASYWIGIFLIAPVTVPLIQNLGIQIQMAKNMHKFRSLTYLAVAISNVFLSIWCIGKWGVLGAAIGTAVSLILGNGLIMNIYYHKKIGLNIISFWKSIVKMLPGVLVAALFGLLINRVINTEKFIFLIAAIAVYSVVYALSMWCLAMNRQEKDLIIRPLEKVLGKQEVN